MSFPWKLAAVTVLSFIVNGLYLKKIYLIQQRMEILSMKATFLLMLPKSWACMLSR